MDGGPHTPPSLGGILSIPLQEPPQVLLHYFATGREHARARLASLEATAASTGGMRDTAIAGAVAVGVGATAAIAVYALSRPEAKQQPSPSPKGRRASFWRRVVRLRPFEFQQEEEGDEQEYVQDAARSAQTVSVQGAQKLQSHVGYNQKLVAEREAIYATMQHIPRIEELDYTPSGKYREASEEEVLWPLIDASNCLLVPGAYFGDEGKGKTVDAIACHPDVQVVARVNSGENAGHTVIGETGIKYDFHLCPSGLLTPGKVSNGHTMSMPMPMPTPTPTST